jgi:hypothetical protein
MHTGEHIIYDALHVLVKSSGEQHKNRTEKNNVRDACQTHRIFPVLFSDDKKNTAPWTISKSISDYHDVKLAHVIGAYSIEIPKHILKKKHGRTSQESIMYGADGWANWCLFNSIENSTTPYVENKLKLFDILRILNSSRIKWTDVGDILNITINALVEHSALFPPCEQTYALHELIHIVNQIPLIGPPKFNNLFMFERVNSTLKRMIKNRCNSMPSIVKSYAVRLHYIYIVYTLCLHCVYIVFTLCLHSTYIVFTLLLIIYNC